MTNDDALDRPMPRAAFARLVGISPRAVGNLLAAGTITPGADAATWLLAYCQHLRREAARRAAQTPITATAKERLALARADLAEMRAAERRGDLIATADVTDAWSQHIAAARAKLLALPTTIAPRIAPPGKLGEAQEIVRDIVYDALNELAGDGLPAPKVGRK